MDSRDRMAGKKRKGAIVGWILTGLLALIVVAGYGLTLPVPSPQDEPTQQAREQEAESEDPWLRMPGLSTSSVYQSGEAVELTGVEPSGGSNAALEEEFGWVGTMRFTASDPVIYASPVEAGIDYEESGYSNYQVIAVDVAIENINARCQPDYADSLGCEAMLLTLFRLLASDPEDDGALYGTVFAGCSAPKLEGLIFDGHQGSSYTWVEPGASIVVRLGFYIIGSNQVGVNVNGPVYEEYDAATTDLNYMLQFSFGRYDGVPVVRLGAAVQA